MGGRDLSKVVGKTKSFSETTNSTVQERAKKTITSEDEKKIGKSLSLRKKTLEKTEKFVRKFNYENDANISLSEIVDTLLETSIDSADLQKVLKNRL